MKNKQRIRTILFWIPIFFMVAFMSCNKDISNDPHSIQQGNFYASVIETGDLQAVDAYTIITPDVRRFGRDLRVIEMVENGQRVEPGDLIIKLDPASVLSNIIEQETNLDVEKANLNKLLVQQESSIKQLNSDLMTAEANFEMKKLELDKFQFESVTKKQVKKLEFQQAEIRLNILKEKLELQKKINKNNLIVQNIRIEQRVDRINKGKAVLDQLNMHTDQSGIAQIGRNRRTGEVLRLGDEVYRNMPLVYIPDIDKMKVISKVNENDISKIHIGQKVTIRLDAYPKIPYEGVVNDIGKLSLPKERNSKIKVFDVEILIKDTDPALKPGMTVSCEFIYADLDDAFYVANECLEKQGNGYFIYKKRGTGFEQQRVKIGSRNTLHTVILGSHNAGTELIPISNIKSLTNI